jgi:hypothetical protein
VYQKYPPRPRWNHKIVKEAVAARFVEEVRAWAEMNGAVAEETEDKEFRVATALAILESPDAYQAGRYLDDFYDWPVNHDLIRIFERAFHQLKPATRAFVQAWVLKNNVRFKAERGDTVHFCIGDLEMSGAVMEVITTEAIAVVKLRGSGKLITVYAEDVMSVNPAPKPNPAENLPRTS